MGPYIAQMGHIWFTWVRCGPAHIYPTRNPGPYGPQMGCTVQKTHGSQMGQVGPYIAHMGNPYGAHMGAMWACPYSTHTKPTWPKWAPHRVYIWVPDWPSGAHMGPYIAQMGHIWFTWVRCGPAHIYPTRNPGPYGPQTGCTVQKTHGSQMGQVGPYIAHMGNPYGAHMGAMWACPYSTHTKPTWPKWAPHRVYIWVPDWPSGAHMGPYIAQMGHIWFTWVRCGPAHIYPTCNPGPYGPQTGCTVQKTQGAQMGPYGPIHSPHGKPIWGPHFSPDKPTSNPYGPRVTLAHMGPRRGVRCKKHKGPRWAHMGPYIAHMGNPYGAHILAQISPQVTHMGPIYFAIWAYTYATNLWIFTSKT